MSTYPFSSLWPKPGSFRLLRLTPPKSKTPRMECQLLNYSLDDSDKAPPLYDAFSYVWGDPGGKRAIFIDGYPFDVTENLHAALWSLRERSIKWIWVDAICIDQKNIEERNHQVRYMAKTYGKANRVLVWLGESADNSDRAFEEIRARKKWSDSSDDETIQQAVLALLRRPCFRRIWILQEVAAARRILIMCGPAEIDGYAFCLGLQSLQTFYKDHPDLHNLVRSVTYLIM
ncbi:HET-domain-containing protein [Zopfia rhizophila CBS 207.26]|uniref:HET-domain-containing protein n=1 Tax=Zopfia rhizophila CBS 207.26 TaxID=1314779 RepID=A0A6A6ERH2_9PEZI|nr:HET-domain-containing protein [Zopfia rhizophila CBS 207.26]